MCDFVCADVTGQNLRRQARKPLKQCSNDTTQPHRRRYASVFYGHV